VGKVINSTAMTVDGLVDVRDWFVAEGDHDGDSMAQFDGAAMLMGRKTYEGLAAYWPHQTGPWADLSNSMRKFVASRTLKEPLEWNATLIEGDAVQGVERLKNEFDGNLILIGCGDLARLLLANGLVDEVRFWVHPAIGGEGTRPYGGDAVRIRLLDSTAYDSGVMLLRYEPLGG
jgi:dihydrofolate reductase